MSSQPKPPQTSATTNEVAKESELTRFGSLSEEELDKHLAISQYGSFELTDAIRPSIDLKILPKQGFRQDFYVDPKNHSRIPVVVAAASKNRLFDLFLNLIEALGQEVDVVLETSHYQTGGHNDHFREQIDMPVLQSMLFDYEDLLLNDGCTGIAVMNPGRQQEVQFDEHKMLIAYGSPLEPYERVLIDHDVYPDEGIRFINEAEHVHTSSAEYFQQFQRLTKSLGMDADLGDADLAY